MFILYKENTVTIDKLEEFIQSIKTAYECDRVIDFTGSLENSLLRHPNQPEYNDTKEERMKTCNKNVYDFAYSWAGYSEIKGRVGELYFDVEEEKKIKEQIDNIRGKNGFVILWALAGSGGNKAYPYYSAIWNELICKYKNVKIVSVGDETCRILEVAIKEHSRYIPKSGKWKMIESMIASKYVDLVVCPDTGIHHSAICFNTKILCILGHCTKEHVCKYSKNDYSLESDTDKAPCSPCFRLVYSPYWQCSIESETGTPICMTLGQPKERIIKTICGIIDEAYDKKM